MSFKESSFIYLSSRTLYKFSRILSIFSCQSPPPLSLINLFIPAIKCNVKRLFNFLRGHQDIARRASLLKDVASQRNYLVLTKCSRVLGASKALEGQVVNLGVSLDSICAATWWAQSSHGSSLFSSLLSFLRSFLQS